jgi:hypothetical protein
MFWIVVVYMLFHFQKKETSLQLRPVEKVLFIALYPELSSCKLRPQGPGYRCSPHPFTCTEKQNLLGYREIWLALQPTENGSPNRFICYLDRKICCLKKIGPLSQKP